MRIVVTPSDARSLWEDTLFQRAIFAIALALVLMGCEVLNGKLPSHFTYHADCDQLSGCLLEACEDCEEACLGRCWRNVDDTAVNFGCADGEIIHGLAYCHD